MRVWVERWAMSQAEQLPPYDVNVRQRGIRKWRNLIVFSSGNRGLHMNGNVISSFSVMVGRLTAGWFHDENYEFKSRTEVSTVLLIKF